MYAYGEQFVHSVYLMKILVESGREHMIRKSTLEYLSSYKHKRYIEFYHAFRNVFLNKVS